MMKRFVAAALFLFPSVAQADYFDTGNDLWGLCTDKFPGHDYLCLGLPAAYFDMMLATGYQCAATGVARTGARRCSEVPLGQPRQAKPARVPTCHHLIEDRISMRRACARTDRTLHRIDAKTRQAEGPGCAHPEPLIRPGETSS